MQECLAASCVSCRLFIGAKWHLRYHVDIHGSVVDMLLTLYYERILSPRRICCSVCSVCEWSTAQLQMQCKDQDRTGVLFQQQRQ